MEVNKPKRVVLKLSGESLKGDQEFGLDSDILGTVATQGISRKEKENRDSSYGLKKQKRMWRDRMYAFKHLYF